MRTKNNKERCNKARPPLPKPEEESNELIAEKPKAKSVESGLGIEDPNLKKVFGSSNTLVAFHLAKQLYHVVPKSSDPSAADPLELAFALERAIRPRDDLEGMLAAQMVGIHNTLMTCLRRANQEGQTVQGVQLNIDWANKLARTFTSQLETLNRHRGKGQQKVTVEHVTVNQGGQAIVGVVDKSGRGPGAYEEG